MWRYSPHKNHARCGELQILHICQVEKFWFLHICHRNLKFLHMKEMFSTDILVTHIRYGWETTAISFVREVSDRSARPDLHLFHLERVWSGGLEVFEPGPIFTFNMIGKIFLIQRLPREMAHPVQICWPPLVNFRGILGQIIYTPPYSYQNMRRIPLKPVSPDLSAQRGRRTESTLGSRA